MLTISPVMGPSGPRDGDADIVARRSLAVVRVCDSTCSAFEDMALVLVQVCQTMSFSSWEAPLALLLSP
eukprot:c29359_g4_i1 orf=1-204(-)